MFINSTILMVVAASVLGQPATVRAHVDHIILGIRNLDEGIAAFERLTGIRADKGGQHPTRGTENALASLGAGRYLEIMAPRPGAPLAADRQALSALAQLTVIGWAVNVSDMGSARSALADVGVTLAPEAAGSRLTPSGTTLEWSTADVTSPDIPGAPFLIHWNVNSEHPSTTSPAGCTVSALEVRDPAAADLSRALNALRVSGVTIRRGDAQIAIALKCPKGLVTLLSAERGRP